MAKQIGIIKLRGSIGDVTFALTEHGYIAKAKSSLDKARVLSDPAFKGTRRSMSEFTYNAHAGSYLRESFEILAQSCRDRNMCNRMTSLMAKIRNKDIVSAWGQRKAAVAFGLPEARQMLKGFEFNDHAHLANVLLAAPEVDIAAGTVTLRGFDVGEHLMFPEYATHVLLRSAMAKVNFETGEHRTKFSEVVRLATSTVPGSGTGSDLVLSTEVFEAVSGDEVCVMVLKVEFVQEVNGVDYGLNHGKFGAMGIVGVW